MTPGPVTPLARRTPGPATLALVALLVAGCTSSSPDSQETPDTVTSPTASADDAPLADGPVQDGGAGFGPQSEQPRDTREVSGDGFRLFAPAAFQQSTRPGPDDVPMVVLATPSEQAGGVVEVIAFREVDAPSDARDQMTALAALKTDLGGVTDLQRQDVEWPGAADGVFVEWTEATTTAEGSVAQHFAQLALDVEDGSLVTAVAVAPADEFAEAGLLDVLRSLTVGAAA